MKFKSTPYSIYLSKARKRIASKAPIILSTYNRNTGAKEEIPLDAKPNVLILGTLTEECYKRRCWALGPSGRKMELGPSMFPNIIWFYFKNRILAAIVAFDGCESKAVINNRLLRKSNTWPDIVRSYEKYRCQGIWPQHVDLFEGGTIDYFILSDRTEMHPGWSTFLLRFNEELYGTDTFWKPLRDSHAGFTADEIEAICHIVAQKSGKASPIRLFGDLPIAQPIKDMKLGALKHVDDKDFKATEGFTHIVWRGKLYRLRRTAAAIIEILYLEMKNGYGGLHQHEIFSAGFSEGGGEKRVQNLFRHGEAKQLWDDGLIQHDRKGNFWLNIEI